MRPRYTICVAVARRAYSWQVRDAEDGDRAARDLHCPGAMSVHRHRRGAVRAGGGELVRDAVAASAFQGAVRASGRLATLFPMPTPLTPTTLRAPFSNYAHAVEVAAGARLLFVSGQLGVGLDDAVPEGAAAQAELCFDNVEAVLHAAGMTLDHVVRVNAYVSAREHLAAYMAVRNARFAGREPASTLMIVSGFAREAFVVEVEIVAADERASERSDGAPAGARA